MSFGRRSLTAERSAVEALDRNGVRLNLETFIELDSPSGVGCLYCLLVRISKTIVCTCCSRSPDAQGPRQGCKLRFSKQAVKQEQMLEGWYRASGFLRANDAAAFRFATAALCAVPASGGIGGAPCTMEQCAQNNAQVDVTHRRSPNDG